MVEENNLEEALFLRGWDVGASIGNTLTKYFKDKPIPNSPVIVEIRPEDMFNPKKFSKPTRILMKLGSENAGVFLNTGICATGTVTFGVSALSMATTTSVTAKNLYGMSCLFSASGAALGGTAAAARQCEISEWGLLADAFGGVFLYLGNQAHNMALRVEGKPARGRFRPPTHDLYNRRNHGAFITEFRSTKQFRSSRVIQSIPFEQIGRSVGLTLTVYGYVRITITAFRYGQQLIARYKKHKLLKATNLFRSLIITQTSFSRVKKVYCFAVT